MKRFPINQLSQSDVAPATETPATRIVYRVLPHEEAHEVDGILVEPHRPFQLAIEEGATGNGDCPAGIRGNGMIQVGD